jgi:hypothetical protein
LLTFLTVLVRSCQWFFLEHGDATTIELLECQFIVVAIADASNARQRVLLKYDPCPFDGLAVVEQVDD